MNQDEDSLFDVAHSLPVLSYSVALAQRTPTAGYDQQTKYMPDYGGFLETTSSCLKNNAIASGIPFNTKPEKSIIKLNNSSVVDASDHVVCSNNSLIVTSYLETDTSFDLSVIRLLGPDVIFDSLSKVAGEGYNTRRYGCLSSKNQDPAGLKHIKGRNDHLLVKFAKSVQIHELNRSYRCDVSQERNSNENGAPHRRTALIADRTSGYNIRDVCLNPINNNILAIASDNSNIHSVKIFDLSADTRQPFQNIEWATLGNEFPSLDTCLLSKELRGRVVRTFTPIRPTNWGTQQLDHVPSHLCNLLVTNEQKISLIDPRSSTLAQHYLNKAELTSFYPIEYLRRTSFSTKNDYQFYSMTNVHLRVIDTRYPGIPVGQVCHMLESETYNSMDMKSVEHQNCDLETLCCSSLGRISFMSFDQSSIGNLINPKSTHLPFHDTSLNVIASGEDFPAYGLGVIGPRTSKSDDELFSIFQLSSRGDLMIRSFTGPNDLDLEQSLAKVHLFTDENQFRPIEDTTSLVPIRNAHDMPDRFVPEDLTSSPTEDQINLLDANFLEDVENKLDSKRAQEKYVLMKNKLCRV